MAKTDAPDALRAQEAVRGTARPARLTALVLVPLLVLVLSVLSLPARALALQTGEVSARLQTMVIESSLIEKALSEIRAFKKAGFIYQPQLSISSSISPTGREEWDWRAVTSGMVTADRDFAFCFGSVADVQREQKVLQLLLPKVRQAGLGQTQIAAVQKAMHTPKGQAELARYSSAEMKRMFALAGENEQSLRFLGGFLYGNFIERLYTSSIMVLAAVEEDTMDALTGVELKTAERMQDILLLLARNNVLGDRELSAERGQVVQKLVALVKTRDQAALVANLRKVVDICQDERDDVLDDEDDEDEGGRP